MRSLFLVLYLLLSWLLLFSVLFLGGPTPSVVVPAATLPSTFHSTPSPVFCLGTSLPSSASPPPFLLVHSFIAPDGSGDEAPAALLPDADSVVHAVVPGSVLSESRRMLVFPRDRFPQAAGVHSAPPSSLVFWSWSVRFPTVLFLLLLLAWSLFFLRVVPPSNSASAVRSVCALGLSAQYFSSLFSLL